MDRSAERAWAYYATIRDYCRSHGVSSYAKLTDAQKREAVELARFARDCDNI